MRSAGCVCTPERRSTGSRFSSSRSRERSPGPRRRRATSRRPLRRKASLAAGRRRPRSPSPRRCPPRRSTAR